MTCGRVSSWKDRPTFEELAVMFEGSTASGAEPVSYTHLNGGEGKSQIGAVLSAIFGTNMKDGSIGKISENRFARADLEHILLCVCLLYTSRCV